MEEDGRGKTFSRVTVVMKPSSNTATTTLSSMIDAAKTHTQEKMPTAKKKVVIKPVEVPTELADKVNPVKSRMLFLSPSVLSGEERECRKDDFESLANSNIGVGGFGKVYKVRHKVSKNVFAIKVINKKKILEHDLVE